MPSVFIVVWLFNLIYELSIFHSRWLFVVWITICLQFFHWLFTIDNVSSLHSAAGERHVQIEASPSRVVVSWINFNSYLFHQRLLFLRLWQKNNIRTRRFLSHVWLPVDKMSHFRYLPDKMWLFTSSLFFGLFESSSLIIILYPLLGIQRQREFKK